MGTNPVYGWHGKKVRLVPIDKAAHMANALHWLNDPEVTEYTIIGDWPIYRLAEEEWFDSMTRGHNDTDAVFAIETMSGEHIGISGIHNIEWRHGFATTGTVIGRKDLWGQGYATDAAAVRSLYSFEVLGLRLLMTSVYAGNSASLGMLRRVGYKEVGRIPGRYWKRGAFRDMVILVLEVDDWLNANRR
jgi:RimJ/RimL family protein N-acetyltransferase